MNKYICLDCGYIIDEEKGVLGRRMPPSLEAMRDVARINGCAWHRPDGPENDPVAIEPGTKWEDVDDSFKCPNCGAEKDMFENYGQEQR